VTLLYSTHKPHHMTLGTLLAANSPPRRSRRLLASKARRDKNTTMHWRLRSHNAASLLGPNREEPPRIRNSLELMDASIGEVDS
jgi:hypothetical protein